jgi:uncharacterized repeat protein (TIGR01451 family)
MLMHRSQGSWRECRAWSLACVIASFLVSAGFAQASSTLNFPRLAFESGRFTGIAIVNPSAADAVVTLTAYGEDGKVLTGSGFVNPAQLTIKANQQIAKLTSEVFGTGLQASTIGWMQATGPVDGLTGFFLFLDSSITFLDGADLPSSSGKFAFHQVRSGAGYSTEIDIVNPAAATANVQVDLVAAGAPRIAKVFTLAGKGMKRLDVGTFFEVSEVSSGAYVQVQSSAEIAGTEFVKNPQGELLGLNGRPNSERLDRLVFPQLAVLGDYKTELGVINYSTAPVVLTITAFRPDGTLFDTADLKTNPVTRTLNGSASLREDLATLFGFSGSSTLTGWVEVKSTDGAISGYVTSGTPASGGVAAVATAPAGRTRALFSHIATSGYFTGIAALNAGTLAANIRIVAMKPTGEILGSYDGVLQPGARIAKLVGTSELIPEAANQNGGLIWVKSDLPIFLASIFGSNEVLANVPPQDAPEGYAPDKGLAVLRIKPPLAIVKPSQTQAFQVEGASGTYEWKVNGTVGGRASTGTITAAGIFTAPSTVPARQVATITAESAKQAAGASIDVLEKTAVAGNFKVIQSVAYLSSLGKLYAAEFTALSGFQDDPSAVDNGNSQVLEVSPAGAKTTVQTFTGENIGKLLAFTAFNGKDYLLISGQLGGRIIRLDPVTRQFRNVVTGLKEPSALVFDQITGDLLVAEKDKVTIVQRFTLEMDLSAAPSFLDGSRPGGSGRIAALPVIAGAAGLASDRCTGKLYYTVPAEGLLVEYDGATGKSRTVLSGLRNPGALLALYRSGGSCPSSFQLLVSEKGLDRTLLVSTDGSFVEWLAAPGVNDLAYLPSGNPYGSSEGIVVGENAGTVGSVSFVKTSNLYQSSPSNPPEREPEPEDRSDLSLSVTVTPELVAVGGTLTYTATVTNRGPQTAGLITLADRLPSDLTFVSATSPQGTCANTGGTVECSIGFLARDRQAVVTLRATVRSRPTSGAISNTFIVTSARAIDTDIGNNTATARSTVSGTGSAATFLGPSPYLCRGDSPFAAGILAGTTFLETFEDGLLNTPGVTASGGTVRGPENDDNESVDCDDGKTDGLGLAGHDFRIAGSSVTFTFSAAVLGRLPTQAGFVWTGNRGTGRFEAFDASGASLGAAGPFEVPRGPDGDTAEDRFLGVTYSGGISRIVFTQSAEGFSIDHLQYGLPAPAPAPLNRR